MPEQPISADQSVRHRRCRAAIAGEGCDRVPTYVPAIACDVSSQILGRRAFTGTGSLHYAEVLAWAKGESAHAEFVARMLDDLVDVHRALDLDVFRMPWRMNVRPSRQLDENTFFFGSPDGDYDVWRYNPESADFGPIETHRVSHWDEAALQRQVEEEEADLARSAPEKFGVPEDHLKLCQQLGDEFFVVCNGGGISVGLSETDLMSLALVPDLVRRKMRVHAERGIQLGQSLAASGCPKVLLGGGDLAGNQGLMYSPSSFRSVVLPAYRHLLQQLNPLDVHYVFRSDGNLWPIATDLFTEAECPGYGETDRDAGMNVADLRKRLPRLVIWGNFSSSVLRTASENEVRDESRRIIGESGGTRYLHGCSNAIVKGTPARNVEALFSVRC